MVPVRGQVGEQRAVQGAQGAPTVARLCEQRLAARIDLGYLGDFPGGVLQVWSRYQQRGRAA